MRAPASPAVQTLGASSYKNAAVGTGAGTIFTPATNVNGVWIRTIDLLSSLSTAQVALFIGTAAPTSQADVVQLRIAHEFKNTYAQWPLLPLFVPAGNGYYVISSAVSGGAVWTSYDVL